MKFKATIRVLHRKEKRNVSSRCNCNYSIGAQAGMQCAVVKQYVCLVTMARQGTREQGCLAVVTLRVNDAGARLSCNSDFVVSMMLEQIWFLTLTLRSQCCRVVLYSVSAVSIIREKD